MLRLARHIGWAAASATLLALGWLVACDDSSSGGGLPEIDSGTVNVGDASGTTPTGDDDAGGVPDGGGSFTEPAIALVNLTGAPLDFCHRPDDSADWVGPVFSAIGGLPDRTASVKVPVPVNSKVALVVGGMGCGAPIFTPGSDPPPSAPNLTLIVRGGSVNDARKVFSRPQDHIAGKETVYFGQWGRDAVFEPSGGGAEIEITSGAPVAIDPNLTGQLVLTAPSAATQTRAMKTGAGVVLLVEPESGEPLLCDLLAPPNGQLLRCGADVRAP